MSIDDRVERFSAGESFAVDPDAIERELALLWREAGNASEVGQPVTRACLWNVVVHVEARKEREGHREEKALLRMMENLPLHLAYRGLVLRTQAEEAGQPSLESWISARCIPAGGGGKLVCSEELTFAARGDGDQHLPGLVRALLVPGVPTAAVFGAIPDISDPVVQRVVDLADRIIIHADRSDHDAPLGEMRWLLNQSRGFGMDIGWLGHDDLRQDIAALFDPPMTVQEREALDEVQYVTPPGKAASARLMLGWIARALGALEVVPKPSTDKQTWQVTRRNGIPFWMVLTEDHTTKDPSVSFHDSKKGTSMTVTCRSGRIDSVASGGDAHTLPRPRPTPEAMLAQALGSRGQDDVFGKALQLGSTL